MPRLHLLNQDGPQSPQPSEISPGVMESGWWQVSDARANSMIGHPIHFHRRKALAAYLSGIVTGFRREIYTTSKGKSTLRTVFLFTPQPDGQILADPEGWTLAGVRYLP